MGNNNSNENYDGSDEDCIRCNRILKENNINSKKDFLKWSVKNHPDKGGSEEIYKEISSCNDIIYGSQKEECEKNKFIFKERNTEPQPSPFRQRSPYERPESPPFF
jgi:hypothetical protein